MTQLAHSRIISFFVYTILISSSSIEIFAQNYTEYLSKSRSLQMAHSTDITCVNGVPMCITGYVWSDDNHDDERDPQEGSLSQVEVALFSFTGLPVGRTFTDREGFFSFNCLQANIYSLDLPEYWYADTSFDDPTVNWHTIESVHCPKTSDREILLPIRPKYSRQCLSSTQRTFPHRANVSDSQCVQHLLFLPMIVH